MRGTAGATALAVIAGLGAGAPAAAADFYKDKTISIVVGSAAGGSYDAYARLMSRHLGNHIAGAPTVIVRNMPGAAGVQSAQFVYAAAPKDGTSIGAPLNTVPLAQVLDPGKIALDCAQLQWLGTPAAPANVLAVWHASGIKTLADAKTREVTIGATTPGTTMEMYPLMANHLFGTKLKVVTGYLGGAEINLAMERGEVEGRGSNSYLSYTFQNADWIRDHKLNFLFQMTLKRDTLLPDVPALIEFAENDEQRQIVSLLATSEAIGRPLMAPPGVPAERIAILRTAVMDTVNDPALRADAEKAKLEIQPISGDDMQRMIESIVHTKPAIVEKYKEAVRSRRG